MAFSNGYTIGFAAGICIVCSLGVATASLSLRDLQEANKRRDAQSKVLSAVGLPEKGDMPSGEELDKLYQDRIELVIIDDEGKKQADATYEDVKAARAKAKGTDQKAGLYPVYLRKDSGTVAAYALEMQGKGLWGPLSGYLALNPDGRKVMGATFDAPKETPGLGAEIMKPWFQDQWTDKRIVGDGNALTPIDVVKGSASLACPGRVAYCVDGVSGATITSRGVDAMLEDALDDYKAYLKMIQSS